jgi:hypothetical protein
MDDGREKFAAVIMAMACCLMACGCEHRAAKAADPPAATHPAATEASGDGVIFRDARHGFSVKYPRGWARRKGDSAEDVLTIDKDPDKHTEPEVTIDVPKLPPHIPGMIPLSAVESGYVDDVKKRMKNVSVVESKPVKVDGAPARRFVLCGEDKDGKRKLVVLAILKGDHLYMVGGEGPADEFETVEAAFEQVSKSWKWKEK